MHARLAGAVIVVMFFLCVAVLNLGLGYALRMYLETAAEGLALLPTLSVVAKPLPVAQPLHVTPPPAAPHVDAAVSQHPLADPVTADAPESAAAKAAGSPLQKVQKEFDQYRDQLAALDSEMRQSAGAADAAAMQSYLVRLKKVNQDYLDQHTPALLAADDASSEADPVAVAQLQLAGAAAQQAADIQSAIEHFDDITQESNLLIGFQQLLDETAKLVDANFGFRDSLDEAQLQAARRGGPGDLSPAGESVFPGLAARADLEARLSALWAADPSRSQSISLAMVDIDNFRQLNDMHGLLVGDRLLGATTQVLVGAARNEDLVSRFGGPKFLLLCPDQLARDTANVVEKVRQTVEATQFKYHGASVAVTVSCAVVESTPEDSLETLLSRAESTLGEAKRYGRNRTFLHDGIYPAPVAPPNLTIEQRTLEV